MSTQNRAARYRRHRRLCLAAMVLLVIATQVLYTLGGPWALPAGIALVVHELWAYLAGRLDEMARNNTQES